jgi:hypothetical protein
LDDYDLIAHFERCVLEHVKDQTVDSPSSLRLWNFELDAEENKTTLVSTVSLSGVMHLYSLLERALLSTDAPQGLNVPSKKYGNVKNIENNLMRRLDGVNLLGQEVAKSTSRVAFTPEVRRTLQESFYERYGKYIVRGYQEFYPFEAMANAAINLEVELRNRHEIQCHAMLFEGQGILRVFESYIEQLEAEFDEKYPDKNYPPELKAVLDDFRATRTRLRGYQEQFSKIRTKQFLKSIAESKIVDPVSKAVQDLYRTMFTTTAFQNALFITFFAAMEAYNKEGKDGLIHGDATDDGFFTEYMASLNRYFKPESDADVKRLLLTFSGNVSGTFGSQAMKVTESAYTLRRIVIPHELKPDEWGRFRYILLEMWHSEDERMDQLIRSYVQKGREDVLESFFRRELKDYCEREGIEITDIEPKMQRGIEREALKNFSDALGALIGPLSKEEKQKLSDFLLNKRGKTVTTVDDDSEDTDSTPDAAAEVEEPLSDEQSCHCSNATRLRLVGTTFHAPSGWP